MLCHIDCFSFGSFRFKENTVTSQEGMSEDTVLLSEQQHTGHIAKSTDSKDQSSLSTGEYTLDQALEIHLNICIALLRVRKHIMDNIGTILSNCQKSVFGSGLFHYRIVLCTIYIMYVWGKNLYNYYILYNTCINIYCIYLYTNHTFSYRLLIYTLVECNLKTQRTQMVQLIFFSTVFHTTIKSKTNFNSKNSNRKTFSHNSAPLKHRQTSILIVFPPKTAISFYKNCK